MVQSREEKLVWQKKYNKEHREEIKAYKKRYYENNLEKIKQYRKDHHEEILTRKKQYRKDHREEIKIQNKQYYKEHREEIKIQKEQYYKDNHEEIKIQKKQYYKDHPEVTLRSNKKRLTELGKTFNLDYELMMYALISWSKTVRKRDGKKCTWCNSTQNLVAHHIWQKAYCPESALDVDNGITLCHECHMEQHRLDRSDN